MQQTSSWYDYKTHKEILNIKFFSKIPLAVEISGVTGLDRLYAFMIVAELQKFFSTLQKGVMKDNSWIEMLSNFDKQISSNFTVQNAKAFYQKHNERCTKVWPQILDWVLKIGNLQILRKHISYQLNTLCKFNSKNLESSLRTLNE